ncbi:MAG: hypothetical protein DSZ33_04055 [Gammaproteobacteria bacterium]|nr:MAG: hypothetical protein DSZ33_04055 [Gammaproteobacteria bacterium]
MSIRPDQPLFYLETLPEQGDEGLLIAEESRHVLASRRMGVGDRLYLTDGRGVLASAVITNLLRKREVMVRIEKLERRPRPLREWHVAAATPKGDRMTTMLDMLTQLGMTRFTPLLCEHSPAKMTDKTLGRWRRVCLAACKQSRRVWLPGIMAPVNVAGMLESAGDARILLAQPGNSQPDWDSVRYEREIIMLTGPEGGFSAAELDLMKDARVEAVDLGENILRVETAAVALMSMAACGGKLFNKYNAH